jgi:hypothetical protein
MPSAERVATVILGLYLGGSGLRALGAGHWSYPDGLGFAVPAPLALALGVVLVGIAWRRGRAERPR